MVAGEHAVIAGHVEAGRRDQGAEACEERGTELCEAAEDPPARMLRVWLVLLRREATARPGLGRGLARGRGHCRAALPQRPRPLRSPPRPGHRRRVRGAGRRRAALFARAAADAGAHDRRARAGPRGHPRCRRRPRHRPRAGRLRPALARRPAPRARLTVHLAASGRATLASPPDGHNAAPARAPPMLAWTCYAPEEV